MKAHAKRMTNIVSALTARAQFGQIMKRASLKNERFVVDRRGHPSVIIMGIKDFVDTIAPPPAELRAMQESAKKAGVSLTMHEIDDVIAAVRAAERSKRSRRHRDK